MVVIQSVYVNVIADALKGAFGGTKENLDGREGLQDREAWGSYITLRRKMLIH